MDTRIREREISDRIEFCQRDNSASFPDLSLHRRGRSGRHEKRRERTQESCGGDVELGLEFVEMHVAALAGGRGA